MRSGPFSTTLGDVPERARVADRIICQGRRVDHEHLVSIGPACGKRAHPGCWTCDQGVSEDHGAWIAEACRASGWSLGPQSEDGRFPYAMCRQCRRGRMTGEEADLFAELVVQSRGQQALPEVAEISG